MPQNSINKPQTDAWGDAAVPAFLQIILFLFGTAVGTAGLGGNVLLVVLGAGLCVPIALAFAENWVCRSAPIGEGAALHPDTRAWLAALVTIFAGVYLVFDSTHLCVTLIFAPVVGIAVDHLLASLVIGLRQFREGRVRGTWTRVEVLALDGDIATLRYAGELSHARVMGEVPLGIAYADIDETPAAYRLPAIASLRNFESELTRRVRRALGKLAIVKLGSALTWGAVAFSPFMGAVIREFQTAW